MHHIDDKKIADILDYSTLADALDRAFRAGGEIPARQQYPVDVPGGNSGHLLLMPAWQTGGKIGVKIVTVFPDNSALSLATVNASYLLMDAKTGVPDAMMDGNELTRRRTAAASMLAARYLARLDSKHLLPPDNSCCLPESHGQPTGFVRLSVPSLGHQESEKLTARTDQLLRLCFACSQTFVELAKGRSLLR